MTTTEIDGDDNWDTKLGEEVCFDVVEGNGLTATGHGIFSVENKNKIKMFSTDKYRI